MIPQQPQHKTNWDKLAKCQVDQRTFEQILTPFLSLFIRASEHVTVSFMAIVASSHILPPSRWYTRRLAGRTQKRSAKHNLPFCRRYCTLSLSLPVSASFFVWRDRVLQPMPLCRASMTWDITSAHRRWPRSSTTWSRARVCGSPIPIPPKYAVPLDPRF